MELVREAAETGLPVIRHPFVHYPHDHEVYGLDYQFMVGSEFMVAPVLDPGEDTVEVYLTAGRCVHLWMGKTYGSPDEGVYETIDAPIGERSSSTKRVRRQDAYFKQNSNSGACSN
jgi:alpha-glucosidase